PTGKHHPPRARKREVDVPGRPAEADGRRPHTPPEGPVRAIGPTVRIRARNELSRCDESLFGKVEMKDAVSWCRVVWLFDPVQARELAPDGGLLLIVWLSCEDEMVVGDGRLTREDRPSSSDLVERVNRER